MAKKVMNVIFVIAMVLLVIGGLNWGLIGLINFNLVESLFGSSLVASIIYMLVGLSALYVALAKLFMKKKR
jgi:uncharacterized membrane protein YuzA (DUF378 family)